MSIYNPPTIEKKQPALVAVTFTNGVYREFEGKIYRHIFDKYPLKKHHHTGFKSLQDILDSREGAVPVYEGEAITIQF